MWFGQHLGTSYTGEWWGDQQAVEPSTGGARPTGGWYDNTGWEALFLRPVRDERELVEAVAEKIIEPDNGPGSVEVEWSGERLVFDAPPTIDWGAVQQIQARPEGPNHAALLDAVRRVIEAAKRAQDEDDIALVMLIH